MANRANRPARLTTLVDPQLEEDVYGLDLQAQHSVLTRFAIYPPVAVPQGYQHGRDWPIMVKWTGGNHEYMQTTTVRASFVFVEGENEYIVGDEYFYAEPCIRLNEATGDIIPVYFVFSDGITFPQDRLYSSNDNLRFKVELGHLTPAVPFGHRAVAVTYCIEWGPTRLVPYNGQWIPNLDTPRIEVFAPNEGRGNPRESYLPTYLSRYLSIYLGTCTQQAILTSSSYPPGLTDPGQYFLAQEYVNGGFITLEDFLRDGTRNVLTTFSSIEFR